MALDDTGTLLTITVIGVPFYSGRGLTQSLDPIPASMVTERDINGTLVNLAPSGFQKYLTKIIGKDMRGFAVDGIWPGQIVTIECVAELFYPVAGSPGRSVVGGSQVTEGDHVRYRPSLTMMIVAFTTTKDEWGNITDWELDCEEV